MRTGILICVGLLGLGSVYGQAPAESPAAGPDLAVQYGLAAQYPGDIGIGSDPRVLLYDGFEKYSVPSQVLRENGGVWDGAAGWRRGYTRISTQYHFAGGKSYEFDLPATGSGSEVGLGLVKNVFPHERTLFIRAYLRYASDFRMDLGSSHKGLLISGRYPGPCGGTPRNGTGWFLFLLQNDASGKYLAGEVTPGYGHIYAYWPLQQGGCGDHWYPTGQGFPDYPDFVSRPNFNVPRGTWFSYELMVNLNDVGSNNGEVAVWKDGVLVADFPDLFVRSINDLLIDTAKVVMHEFHQSRANKVWVDNVVIAREYIGPLVH